jgi:uncharacterized membrane protein SpoIIM required for sporulation
MVLEAMLGPLKAERKPWETFFLGILYSSLAMIISLWVFKKESSLIMVFMTVFAAIPLVYKTIRLEERKDVVIGSEKKLLEEHGKAIGVFVFLFLGFLVSFTVWYIFVPQDIGIHLFRSQTETIRAINRSFTGYSINMLKPMLNIFLNNIKVLVVCIILSFIYGSGALFVLTWNASIGGVFIGNFIRQNIARLSTNPTIITYFQAASIGLLRYLPHGVLEMGAYFVAALAGGIISSAVIKHEFASHKFEKILFDASDLILVAVGILLLAAIVEVTITPTAVNFLTRIF